MKRLRALFWVTGGVTVLLVTALVVLRNASFQNWAARRWLAAHPGYHVTFGSIAAGWSRIEARDLKIEYAGGMLSLPSVELDVPVVSLLRKKPSVRRLTAKGWTLDLSHSRDVAGTLGRFVAAVSRPADEVRVRHDFSLIPSAHAAETSPDAGFRGIVSRLHLPVPLALQEVELDGEMVLPPIAAHGPVHVTTTLRGGGLAVGQEGRFVLDLAGAKGDGGALTLHTLLLTAMDSPQTLARLATKTEATVSGTQFPSGVRLTVDASVARSPNGESYTLAWTAGPKSLAALQADYAAGTGAIAGRWRLDLQTAEVAPFALGRPLPEFVVTGDGRFETNGSFAEVHADGQLAAAVDHLERLHAPLAAIGPIKLTGDFDVFHRGDSIRVQKFSAEAANAAPLLRVHALQAFEFNLRTAELRVADPSGDLFGIDLAGVPTAWIQPFLDTVRFSGGEVRGELAAGARDGGLELRSRTPLTVSRLSIARGGSPGLRDVDVSLDATADYTPQGWQAEVTDLALRHGGATLLDLQGRAGRLAGEDRAVKWTARWTADLAAWATQPAAAGLCLVTGGSAQGELVGSVDGTSACEGRIVLAHLATAQPTSLPGIEIKMRAELAADGRIGFRAPIALDRPGRATELMLAGTLRPGPSGRWDAQLRSDSVDIDDLLGVMAILPAVQDHPAGAPSWGITPGRLDVALGTLAVNGQYELRHLSGTVRCDAATVKFDDLHAEASFGGGIQLAGTIRFDPAGPVPYAFAAQVTLANYDAGAAFRALDPTQPPVIEGRLGFTADWRGAGKTAMTAMRGAQGDVQVTGRGGVCRLLAVDLSDKVQKTGSTAAVVSEFLSSVTRKKGYADYANKAQILKDVAKAVGEISFDQLSATVGRDADGNLVLKDFSVISPEVRVTGTGSLAFSPAPSLFAWPLALDLKLGARGKIAALIKRARLLEETQDGLGYAAFKTPIKIGGTLAKPDASALTEAILSSALEKNGLLDRMLGK